MELAALRADDLDPDQLTRTSSPSPSAHSSTATAPGQPPACRRTTSRGSPTCGRSARTTLAASSSTLGGGGVNTPNCCSRRCQASRTGPTSCPTWPPTPPGPAAGKTPGPSTGPGTPSPPTASTRPPAAVTAWNCMRCRHRSATPTQPPPNAPTYRNCPATPNSCGRSPPDLLVGCNWVCPIRMEAAQGPASSHIHPGHPRCAVVSMHSSIKRVNNALGHKIGGWAVSGSRTVRRRWRFVPLHH